MHDQQRPTDEVNILRSVDPADPPGRLPEVLSIGRDRSKLGHRGKYQTRGTTAKE